MAICCVVGLTGSIGAGKSEAAHAFRELGAAIVDADVLAREAVAPGTPGLAAVASAFGPSIITDSGELNRRAMGDLVFANSTARRTLEAIVHPEVRERFIRELERLRAAPDCRVVVYVVPLLFETAADYPEIDTIVVVSAPRELCLQRIVERDGCSLEMAARRLDAQLPLAEKEKWADFVIYNTGSKQELAARVGDVFADITAP